MFLPSTKQRRDVSVPQRNSSITTVDPAWPNCLLSMMLLIASSASSTLSHIKTPLPAASPSALTTIGVLNLLSPSAAFFESVYTSYFADGIEYFFIKSFE